MQAKRSPREEDPKRRYKYTFPSLEKCLDLILKAITNNHHQFGSGHSGQGRHGKISNCSGKTKKLFLVDHLHNFNFCSTIYDSPDFRWIK